jgi:hypothetical protein
MALDTYEERETVNYNIFADVPPERPSTLAEQIVSAFKGIWPGSAA